MKLNRDLHERLSVRRHNPMYNWLYDRFHYKLGRRSYNQLTYQLTDQLIQRKI